jgi:hypothetical protein
MQAAPNRLSNLPSNLPSTRLMQHLVLAVLIKLLALGALWWVFERDARVSVDGDGAAARMLAAPSASLPATHALQGLPK